MSSSNHLSRASKGILTREDRGEAGPEREGEKARAEEMVLPSMERFSLVARGVLPSEEVYVSPSEILRAGSAALGEVNSETGM